MLCWSLCSQEAQYCSLTTKPKVEFFSPTTQPNIEYCSPTTKPKDDFCSPTTNPKLCPVVGLLNQRFSTLGQLPNPKLSIVVWPPNQKLNSLVWLPNPKSCPSVYPFVINFLVFQKRCFKITNSNLSNAARFILLDSLLQEFTMGAMYICISFKLWVPKIPFWGFRTCSNLLW